MTDPATPQPIQSDLPTAAATPAAATAPVVVSMPTANPAAPTVATAPAGPAIPAASVPTGAGHEGHGEAGFLALAVGAVGVVYGDIGTSPLYALKETIAAATHHGRDAVSREMVLGLLSLILWSLVLVVTVKYVLIIMRADNNGEGGTLTLVALAQRATGRKSWPVLLLGIAGAALFYGDAMITPAISVLSAVEGLKLVAKDFFTDRLVLTIAAVILLGLFMVQSRGTGSVAAFFGPVMVVWFIVLTVLGLYHIADEPAVFLAINPMHGASFLFGHPTIALAILGSACLAVTGAEALYADMGHFGRGPISRAWLYFVFPALVINYFGQGALILSNAQAAKDPFYLLAPAWAVLPLVILATLATIIASQAVITGAFSLTRQAIQLGLLPRLEVRFTSETQQGQIYMPRVNWALAIGVLLLVGMFQSSSSLANAYGIAVFGAMAVDAVLAFIVIRRGWGFSFGLAALMVLPFLAIDIAFFSANAVKLFSGGFVPLLMALGLIILMTTWVKGTAILFEKTRRGDVPMGDLIGMLQKSKPHRVTGTAVFLTSDPTTAPTALLHNLKHNKVLHEKNLVLTVKTVDTPRVPEGERVTIEKIGEGFWRARMAFGYMESPNVPKGFALMRKQGFKSDIMATSFFLSRRHIRPAAHSGMSLWRDKIYIVLAKNATDATDFFQIPTGRVVEIGTQVTV